MCTGEQRLVSSRAEPLHGHKANQPHRPRSSIAWSAKRSMATPATPQGAAAPQGKAKHHRNLRYEETYMDLNTVTRIIPAHTRQDLAALGDGAVPLAGGSVLFAEPNPALHTLVDLQPLGWPDFVASAEGLEVAATTTLASISRLPNNALTVEQRTNRRIMNERFANKEVADEQSANPQMLDKPAARTQPADTQLAHAQPAQGGAGWAAHPLFYQCCTALFGSFKVWNVATAGGNICTALPAGPMTSLFAALDAEALIWRPDGRDIRMPVARLVTGDTTTALESGDVLRSLHIPMRSLNSRTAYRKIALSALGRSGAVLIGRLDPIDGTFVLTVTAATVRPEQLRFTRLPEAGELHEALGGIDSWFTDAHGAADWRLAVSRVLAEEIRAELATTAPGEDTTGSADETSTR
jgi:CO/xanthine dehydrogenase FAD-binding subunit